MKIRNASNIGNRSPGLVNAVGKATNAIPMHSGKEKALKLV
jgi:hypothetical protein